MARYRLGVDDIPFAHEFMAKPFGYKSPGLQRVLNVMRGAGPQEKYVLLCREPYRRWQLGRLPAKRGEGIMAVEGVYYGDLASAERDVFLRRWRDLGGPQIDVRPKS